MTRVGLGAMVLALAGGAAQASPLPRYGLFLFSSLCADPQGGDLGGAELVVMRTPAHDAIIFSYGAGPLFGTAVEKLAIVGDKLTAKLSPGEGGSATLTAILSAERAEARASFDGAPARGKESDRPLTRVTNFSRALPVCR
jgi:hypothetical protein